MVMSAYLMFLGSGMALTSVRYFESEIAQPRKKIPVRKSDVE
jgi:hypothetical protein